MGEQEKRPKPFYKDRDDTLEDAGITAKQLRTWREAGLFTAELGPNTRKFTEMDIANLKFLKQLIVGLGLRIETVQHMLQGEPSPYAKTPLAFTYLNVQTGKLVRQQTALFELARLYAGTENLAKVEEWLLTLALRCFEQFKQAYPSPKVYEAKRDELLERLRRVDLAARAQDSEEDYEEDAEGNMIAVTEPPQFVPNLSGDPEPTPDLVQKLARERDRRLRGIRQAEARAWQEVWYE